MLLLLALVAAIFWLPSPWGVVAVAAAAVWEVLEITLFVWYSRRRRVMTGAEALPGSTAVVVEACRPLGSVRLAGELWRARCEEGADPGETVVVEALGPDLTLIVRRDGRI
ncbi:MAG: NfeD family protein [Gaiellaceae bacterium]|jgi:membrane protein implicated in regulation of membrane protease activity